MANKKSCCELCGDENYSCDKKDIRVYFCPSCKSTNVKYIFGLGNLFGVMPKMKCLKCGYTAPSFPILETNKKEISKVRKKVARKQSVSAKLGKKKSTKKIKKRSRK